MTVEEDNGDVFGETSRAPEFGIHAESAINLFLPLLLNLQSLECNYASRGET